LLILPFYNEYDACRYNHNHPYQQRPTPPTPHGDANATSQPTNGDDGAAGEGGMGKRKP